ncbi:TonB-dependent receptor [Vibrio sp. SCSIO 43135]|uniref:TonB-dependent receptor n=1 Tax=Vibrio paucivorans TaxID=2829489 RepID=A0A9X3HTW3_9VIBR|nr:MULTISPECIES: TonB-dependent receptor [Vibrio]MCW8336009.1 TonB-dependent receptor [Vibrio paucivorans]USD43530.1 TonB-dependent receptor [Vibrio sp. SCSIO 43135]
MKRPLYSLLLSLLVSPSVFASSFSLPIWKEKAEALGYELPKPIGFNISYMSMEQGISVDSIMLKGLDIPGLALDAQDGTQKTEVVSFRADVWLFPFLNVYALFGILEGYSQTDVDASLTMNIPPLFPGGKPHEYTVNGTINDFRLDLDGYTKGVGFVLAGGYGNWFGLVDASYTQSDLTIIDGQIDAIVVSPRVGYDFNTHDVPLRVWVGAMYQDVEQHLSGSVADLGLPPGLAGIVPSDARFEVTQHLTTPWNPLVGMQYQINKDWYLLGEAGFGDRQSIFFSIDRRF